MKIIDKAIHAHAILNMVAAVIQSPNGMLIANDKAKELGVRVEDSVIALGESFAINAIRNIEQSDLVSLPAGSGISDVMALYISGSEVDGRLELEDAMQEGELASNAVALLNNAPELWTPDAPNPDDAPFPGTGSNDGPERINDLIRAAAYVLAEIGRLERKMRLEDEYASMGAQRGAAVMPTLDEVDAQDPETAPPTQH